MSAYSIQGKDCVFQLKIGDVYMDVVCAKNFSLTIATEMKDTTTIGGLGTGWWKEKRPRKLEYSITFNAAVQVVADDDKPTIKTMLQNHVWFLPMDYQIIYRDESNNVLVIRGRVYNANTVITASPSDLLDGTVELQGTGAIEMLDEVPTPITLRLSSTGITGTENAKFRFRLLDATGSVVWQTDDLLESTNGYLVHPFDFTTTIIAGEYYYQWDGETETVNNVFFITTVPSHNRIFGEGVVSDSSFPDTVLDFTEEREVSWGLGPLDPPPVCVDVQIVGSPSMPDGMALESYSFAFSITGTAPFSVSNVTKPEWMTILVNNLNGTVILSGFPGVDDVAEDIEVSFDITNCSSGLAHFSDTFTIAENPNTVEVTYGFTENGDGANGTLKVYKNGFSVPVINRSTNSSGSIYVVAGDQLEAIVSSAAGQQSHLIVYDIDEDEVPTEIYNDSSIGVQSFSFTTEAGHSYNITGETNA